MDPLFEYALGGVAVPRSSKEEEELLLSKVFSLASTLRGAIFDGDGAACEVVAVGTDQVVSRNDGMNTAILEKNAVHIYQLLTGSFIRPITDHMVEQKHI